MFHYTAKKVVKKSAVDVEQSRDKQDRQTSAPVEARFEQLD